MAWKEEIIMPGDAASKRRGRDRRKAKGDVDGSPQGGDQENQSTGGSTKRTVFFGAAVISVFVAAVVLIMVFGGDDAAEGVDTPSAPTEVSAILPTEMLGPIETATATETPIPTETPTVTAVATTSSSSAGAAGTQTGPTEMPTSTNTPAAALGTGVTPSPTSTAVPTVSPIPTVSPTPTPTLTFEERVEQAEIALVDLKERVTALEEQVADISSPESEEPQVPDDKAEETDTVITVVSGDTLWDLMVAQSGGEFPTWSEIIQVAEANGLQHWEEGGVLYVDIFPGDTIDLAA
ncbi:hypothetical protein ACFL06_00805 [Patescibacteria group bacterium]